MVTIRNECSFIKPDGITLIEDKYNAKYVFESCLKTKNGWCNFPVAIFYTEKAHPEGSNYFGFYVNGQGQFMITNGITATEPFSALQIGDDVIYSRYRHDYRSHSSGIAVDGGRDYLKVVGASAVAKPVTLKVVKDKLEIVE